MELTSSAFSHKGDIPIRYTCDGENINPPLHIKDVPQKAVTLVLLVEDPDVPKKIREDQMWDHWILFNINPSTTEISEETLHLAIHGRNTSGYNGYTGPCPPDRMHRYFFKLYALDTTLTLEEGSTKKEVEAAMKGHIIEETVLMGTYERAT